MKKNRQMRFLRNRILKKMMEIVKLTLILLFVDLIPLSAAQYSQNNKISLQVKDSPLEQVFKQIEQQSNYLFVYNHEQLNNKQVTVHVENMEIKEVLDICLKGTGLYYELINNTVVIKKRQQDENKRLFLQGKVTDADSIPLPGVNVRLEGTTVGTVTDTKGEFKLIVPKDSSQFTLTFTFIGMEIVKKKAQPGKPIHVIMTEKASTLNEVVSYGYYNVDKRHLTSSVTSLKAGDIAVAGINTVDQMLEGHVPGMIFMRNSGQVGVTPKVKIRGTTTILGSTAPLWVLDGIILTDPVDVDPASINDLDFVNLLGNAISGLNPDDIDQIDVLKDASATAIYGPKASNGVIVITTKKGKVGEPSISYSVSGTYRLRPRYTDRSVNVMNSQERIAYSRELIDAQLAIPDLKSWVGYESAYYDYCNKVITHDEFISSVQAMETANTDWLGTLMRDTYSQNHTLSISGGTKNIRYYASLGYMDELGNIRGEQNKRYSGMINLNMDYKRFSLHFGLNANLQDKEYTPKDVGVTDYAYNTSRSISPRNNNGSLLYYQRLTSSTNNYEEHLFNIINEYKNSSDDINTDQIGLNLSLSYKLIPSLKAEVVFAYNVSHTNEEIYFGEDTWYISNLRMKNRETGEITSNSTCPVGGELQISNTKNNSYSVRASLNFNKMLDENQHHQLTANVIGELSSSKYTGFNITRRGYLPGRGMIFDAIDIETNKYPSYRKWLMTTPALGRLSHNLTNLVGLVGSVSYSYDNSYILNANMRIDASNKFGDASNDRLLPIWSVSGRWNLQENLLDDVSWLDLLALKMSFGYQGNMSAQDSPRLIIQRQGTNTLFNEYFSIINRYPNPNLKWEKTSTYNIDLEFSLFQNKVQGSIGYYYRNTTDAFLNKKVSTVNGVENYTVNAGHLTNQGVEITLNLVPINTMGANGSRNGFIWRFNPNLGSVINQLIDKVTPKDKLIQDEITYRDYLNGSVQVSGQPMNTFYSYKFKGLNPQNGAPMFYNTDRFVSEGGKEIDMKEVYAGMDKEEVYTTVMERSGCREPYLQGGISNYLGWRNFGLSFNLAYSFGAKIRMFRMYPSDGSIVGPERNLRKELTKRWQRPGDEAHTNIPGILPHDEWSKTLDPWWSGQSYKFAQNIWDMYDNSNLRVVSGNYVRLQSASLRYVIPDQFCKRLNLKSAYISVSGTDLFTICSRKLKGQDPSQSGTSDLINMSVRPTYSLQLNVTF